MTDETLDEKNELSGDRSPAKDDDGGEEEVNGQDKEADEKAEGEAEEKEEVEEEEGEENGKGKEEESVKKKRGRPKRESGAGSEKKATPKKRRRMSEGEEQATPVERPSRERKIVERYSALAPQRSPVPKAVTIQQGSGTQLKDIPNVYYKLNKRKADESLQHLHKILFGKRGKALYLKRNIFQFSGFVWTENQEKQRLKIREKLDKCVKDKLLDFCELLDISVSRTALKKEELSVKLLEFLESPHVTRDLVLADNEQSRKKRKRKNKDHAKSTSGEKRGCNHKPSAKAEVDEGKDTEEEGDVYEDEEGEGGSADDKTTVFSEDEDAPVEGDAKKSESEDNSKKEESQSDKDSEPETPVVGKKASVGKKRGSRSKVDSKGTESSSMGKPKRDLKASSKKTLPATKSSGKKNSSAATAKSKDDINKSQSKKDAYSKEKPDEKEVPASKLKVSKAKRKDKFTQKAAVHPTREAMYAVVSDILKEVDFNTATLADILKQLGTHFKTDLMDRKSEVKGVIEEVINNMTDEEDEAEGDGEDNEGENGGDKEK